MKQIGVDLLDVSLEVVPGYRETGAFAATDLMALVERLDAVGLRIERVTAGGRHIREALLGRPEGRRQTDRLCRVIEMLGQAGVPVMFFPGLSARHFVRDQARPGAAGFFAGQYAGQLVDAHTPGWKEWTGRGGYVSPSYSHSEVEASATGGSVHHGAEALWANLLNVYRQVTPVAESAHVLLAQHGVDPPLPSVYGVPQILSSFADFDRLFAEVPSPNNGMTFCVGTRYESGEDIFEGIRHFGQQGRIHHVHFRNVRGTIPAKEGYTEVAIDDGDLDMMQVLRALHDAGYSRAVDYDHVVRLTGDSFIGRQYVAFAVGYMKGLLAGLA